MAAPMDFARERSGWLIVEKQMGADTHDGITENLEIKYMFTEKYCFHPARSTIEKHILSIGAQQPPNNRTTEFSQFTQGVMAAA